MLSRLSDIHCCCYNWSRDAEEGKVFGKNNRISAIEAGFGERKVTFTAFNDQHFWADKNMNIEVNEIFNTFCRFDLLRFFQY